MSAAPGNYPALELGQPGNEACPDGYTPGSTLLCPGSTRLMLQVSANAVMIQLGVMPQGMGGLGAVVWQPEQPFLPMIAALNRRFDAVRVRNYTKGQKAQALVSAGS